jgi:hypothetical protein
MTALFPEPTFEVQGSTGVYMSCRIQVSPLAFDLIAVCLNAVDSLIGSVAILDDFVHVSYVELILRGWSACNLSVTEVSTGRTSCWLSLQRFIVVLPSLYR